MYLYFLVVTNSMAHFQELNDIFDNLASSLKGMMALKIYETPYQKDILLFENEEREQLRNAAFLRAIEAKHRNALKKIIQVLFIYKSVNKIFVE